MKINRSINYFYSRLLYYIALLIILFAVPQSVIAAAPSNVSVLSVYISSVTVGWAKDTGVDSYILEASTDSNFTPIHSSSATSDVNLSTLTVTGLNYCTTHYFRVGTLLSGVTSWMSSPNFVSTKTLAMHIYRSVGPYETSALASGGSNAMDIAGDVAAFTSALPDNVGVGDAIQYDTDGNSSIDAICFIHGRTSSQQYTVKTASGTTPKPVTGDNDWGAYRAYVNLEKAESSNENDSLDNAVENFDAWSDGKDLVASGEVWNIACYAGNWQDFNAVHINNWTTSEDTYIRIYTPTSSNEVGVSQRHNGKYDTSSYGAYGLSFFGDWDDFRVYSEHVWIDGLQVFANTANNNFLLRAVGAIQEFKVSNCILRGNAATTSCAINTETDCVTLKAWNNLIYNCAANNSSIRASAVNNYIYNNTIVNTINGYAIEATYGGTVIAKNNLIVNSANDEFRGNYDAGTGYNSTDGSDSAGYGTDKINQTIRFVDEDNEDFRLASADTGALNQGDDASGNGYIPFSTDIIGTSRPQGASWDIGCFEVASILGVPQDPAYLGVYNSSITINWDLISDATGYTIIASTDSTNPPTAIHASSTTAGVNATTATVYTPELWANTTYYIFVCANTGGQSSSYNATSGTSTLTVQVSGAQVYSVFNTSVTITWNSLPLTPSSSTCEGYLVQASSTNFGAQTFGGSLYSAATTYAGLNNLTVTGLDIDTTYWFKVGTYNWNNRLNFVTVGSTLTIDSIAPSGITDLTAYSMGENFIHLTWTSPGDDAASGNLISGSMFRIKYSTVSIITAGNFDNPPANMNVTSVDISTQTSPLSRHTTSFYNLQEATTYWFAIKTRDNIGNWSVWNSSADVSTENTQAWSYSSYINLVPDAPTNLTQLDGTSNNTLLSWNSWTNDTTPRLKFSLNDLNYFEQIRYHVQISTSEGLFTNPYLVVDTTQPTSGWLTDGTTWYDIPTNTLTLETSYWWRIKCIDSFNAASVYSSGTLSSGQKHFGLDLTSPTVVDLLGPVDNTTTNYALVTFDWSNSTETASGIEFYEVVVSTAPDLSDIDYSSMTTKISASIELPQSIWYWSVRTQDRANNYCNLAATKSFTVLWIPSQITDLTASETQIEGGVSLSWTAPNEDTYYTSTGTVDGYSIRYATFSLSSLGGRTTSWWEAATQHSIATATSPGKQETATLSLDIGTTYYFAAKSYNDLAPQPITSLIDTQTEAGSQISIISTDFIPIAPTGFSAIANGTSSITLAWDSMAGQYGHADFAYCEVKRSLSDVTYVSIATTTSTGYIDTSIVPGLTYYYKLSSVDEPPYVLQSSVPATANVYIINPNGNGTNGSVIVPLPPGGTQISIASNHPVIIWNSPSVNVDGSQFTDTGGYNIYRSQSLFSGWTLVVTISSSTSVLSWTDTSIDTSASGTYYYKVLALNSSGKESYNSMICATDLSTIAISTTTNVFMNIPQSINDILYKGNTYDDDVIIKIEPVSDVSVAGSLSILGFSAYKALDNSQIAGFKFDSALAKIGWDESEFSGSGALRKAPGNNGVSVFWYNGVEWIQIDDQTTSGVIEVYTSRLGRFMLKQQAVRTDVFTLNKVYPRIFTPNNDNRNDYVEFQYENPQSGEVTGKVYNLRGGLVAELKAGFNQGSLIWDGKDDSGKVMPAGVYVYQLEVTGNENQVVNGIVVIAK